MRYHRHCLLVWQIAIERCEVRSRWRGPCTSSLVGHSCWQPHPCQGVGSGGIAAPIWHGATFRCVQSVPKSIGELKANTEAAQEAVREAEKAVEDAKKSLKALHAAAPLDESQADLDDKRSALAWLAGLMSVAQQPAKEWREVTHHFEYLKLQLHEHYASLTADQPIVRESRRCATRRTVAALHVPSIP